MTARIPYAEGLYIEFDERSNIDEMIEQWFDPKIRTYLDGRNTSWRLVVVVTKEPVDDTKTNRIGFSEGRGRFDVFIEFDDDVEAFHFKMVAPQPDWRWFINGG